MINTINPSKRSDEPLAETAPEIALAFEPIDEHIVLVHLGTALDYRNAECFKTASEAMVQAGTRQFIIDASRVGLLDSTGLGALFSLQRLIGPKDGTVALAALSYPVQTLVNMMRLYRVFPQYHSVEQAHEALRQKAYGDDLTDDPDSRVFSLEDDSDSCEDGLWDFFEETVGSPTTL